MSWLILRGLGASAAARSSTSERSLSATAGWAGFSPADASCTAPILALVGAEILSLMAFVGVCEVRATDIALCESRWALALPAIALAGQSAATSFMDSGRGHGPGTGGRGPGGGGPDGGIPAAVVRHLPRRNRLGQFRSSTSDEDGANALAA